MKRKQIVDLVIFVAAAAVVFLTGTSCGRHGFSDSEETTFANAIVGFESEFFLNGSSTKISRKLFISNYGRERAVVSHISRVSDMGRFKINDEQVLSEYKKNDSIYCFDSADSTLMVFSAKALEMDFNRHSQFSATWLLCNWMGADKGQYKELSETKNLLSHSCKIVQLENKEIYLYENIPLGMETKYRNTSYLEHAVFVKTDTLFGQDVFNFPNGYKRLKPTVSDALPLFKLNL